MENDDEPPTFTQLGLPTALVINRMRNSLAVQALVNAGIDEEKDEPGRNHSKASDDDEQKLLDDLAELNRRIAAIRRWRNQD